MIGSVILAAGTFLGLSIATAFVLDQRHAIREYQPETWVDAVGVVTLALMFVGWYACSLLGLALWVLDILARGAL